jgi:cob(I)alamin adenosyltransferase
LIDRPTHLDMILTGSQMPKSFLDLADQITEIRRLQP